MTQERPHLQNIRRTELGLVIAALPPGGRILELGAGAGWQAKALTEAGFRVEAVDVPDSGYRVNRAWPVTEYDGRRIPFPDGSFDAVFSSNVLEHVPHLDEMLSEIRRVMRADGTAVHVMPTPAWRFWNNISHYAYYLKRVFGIIFHQGGTSPADPSDGGEGRARGGISRIIFPPAHGTRGNCVTEMRYFRKAAWLDVFRRNGWAPRAVIPNGLFYTGHEIFGPLLGMNARRKLSRALGSSALIYIMKPKESGPLSRGPESE